MDQVELATLARQYGEPLRWTRTLDVAPAMIKWAREANQDRRAEIVLAIARPYGQVLLHTKDFYPRGAYRLPSGGINFGEPIEDAARRELYEETGLTCAFTRWLGVVEYEFRDGDARVGFVSHVFLSEESHAAPQTTDPGERITDFRAVAWAELPKIADALDQLPGEWRDWGRFRAIAHRLVGQALQVFT